MQACQWEERANQAVCQNLGSQPLLGPVRGRVEPKYFPICFTLEVWRPGILLGGTIVKVALGVSKVLLPLVVVVLQAHHTIWVQVRWCLGMLHGCATGVGHLVLSAALLCM